MNLKEVIVVRKSPRFQLVKREIEKLNPAGVYHLIANVNGQHPIEYQATRTQLEQVFDQAMSTPSYRDGGLYHRADWPLAEQFRV